MMAMETSSPLAAMQPPSLAASWAQGRHEKSSLDSAFLRPPPYRAGNFDFNKMSMQRPSTDYFSCRPVRGSSPTQSLAVDLSQNFHIDKSSPQILTPRRSLFTSNFLDIDRKQNVITPPIPSSSPGPDHDPMEASPLPHKQPQAVVVSTGLCSPTPDPTLDVELPMAGPQIRRTESQPPSNPACFRPPGERRTSNPMRPSMRKGYSHTGQQTSIKPQSSQSSSQPPFWFGPRSTITKPSLETFMESPPSERKLPPSLSNPAIVASPVSFIPAVQNGSPIANARRLPLARGRSGIGRRSQSMQCNEPYRPVRAEKRCCTTGSIQAASLIPEQPPLKLPHFKPADEVDALPRITKDTFVQLLDGERRAELGEVLVIDCRFEYEFHGGHIEGALNFNDKEEVANKLFEGDSIGNKTLIFHCEYSAHRAPLMAKFVRQRDRTVNQDNYPYLTYPDIYILDGGYHQFFRNHPSRCFPQNYVEMDAKEHETACELGMAKVKRRNKLSRAQTYAFGQSSSSNSSRAAASGVPTLSSDFSKLGRNTSTLDAMDVDFNSPVEMRFPPSSTTHEARAAAATFDSPLGAARLPSRRMESY